MSVNVVAQVNKNFDYHHTLQTNYVLINPAYSSINEKNEVGANYESFRGVQDVFKKIDFYFVSKPIKKLNLGLHFYSDIEESFSSLSLVKGLVNYQLINNENWKISMGAFIGANNYWLQSNQFYGGSSTWSFYSQFGAYVNNKTHHLGISAHHLTSTPFTPLGEAVGFSREYNFYYKEDIKLNPFVTISPYTLYSLRADMEDQWYIGFEGKYYDKYDVQIMFERDKSIVVGANIDLEQKKTSIKVGLSYGLHFYDITNESYQIRIAYFFK